MRLAVIMPPLHPMPPSPGGGVERLVDILLRANDDASEPLDITVFSRFDERAKSAAEGYRHTKFVWLNTTRSEPLSNQLEYKIRRKFGRRLYKRYDYLRALKLSLRYAEADGKFDIILLENCFEFARDIWKLTGKKPYLHAHNRFFGAGHAGAKRDFDCIEKYIFVSEYLRSAAIRAGVDEARTVILRDCVDMSLFNAANYTDMRSEKRAKYGLSDDDILVVFVGRLIPEKGVIELIKAIDQSEYDKSKLKLLLVGSVEYGEDIRDEYRELLENAAPEGRVIFIGSVKPTSTARFLARADIAVVPSVWEEPAGLPVLEAMAIGLPLIVSDSGGIGEYTEEYAKTDGCVTVKRGIGFVTSIAEAIDRFAERLHSDRGWEGEIAAAARRCASKYDSSGYYSSFLNIITGGKD